MPAEEAAVRVPSLEELESRLPVRLQGPAEGGRGRLELEEDGEAGGLELEAPQFLELLGALADRLEPTGRCQASQRKLDEQKERTEAARRKFLEQSLQLEILQEVVLRSEVAGLSLAGASHEVALVAGLREALTMAEVGGMLDLGEIAGERVTTLGLDPTDPRLRPQLPQGFPAQVLPLIEDVLFDKCLALLHLVDPSTEQLSRRAAYPRLARLGEEVRELVAGVAAAETEQAALAREAAGGYRGRLRLLHQEVSCLDSLVTDHYCGSKARGTAVLAKYLAAKTEALVLKLRCLETEILNATYTRESVAAVRKVRVRVSERLAEVEAEVVALRSNLAQYQAAGPELGPVVLEYARLGKEMEGKRWALTELGGTVEPEG